MEVNNKTTIYGDRLELTFGADNKPLAFGKSCSLEITAETLDTSNKMLGNWKESLVGKLSFSLNSDALLTYSKNAEVPGLDNVSKFGDLMSAMVARNPINFTLSEINKEAGDTGAETTFEKGKDFVSGKVVITQLSVTADDGQIATCSVQLQGTGALTIGTDFASDKLIDKTE